MDGYPSGLAREFGRKGLRERAYAFEESSPRSGAATLCAELNITPEIREDHAAYIGAWLTKLKDDCKAIFT